MSEPALLGEDLLDVPDEVTAPPPVSLRGAAGQLVIALDADASFEALRDALRLLMSEAPGRFKGATARLDLGPRAIALFDLRRLVHLLKDEFEVAVTGLYCSTTALQRYAEQELKLKVFLADPEDEDEGDAPAVEAAPDAEDEDLDAERPTVLFAPEPEPEAPAPAPEPPGVRRMLALDRTVRSGATVRFTGDVVVYGDVNAGGQVIATGNILVLGALRGLAHAGCDGDERAVVIGFDLRPTQIRVARMIAIAPDRDERSRRGGAPEIAWVTGDRIVIEEYRGRLPG